MTYSTNSSTCCSRSGRGHEQGCVESTETGDGQDSSRIRGVGEERDAKDADEATKKKYADLCDSIAGALPSMTKGGARWPTLLSNRGDNINRSAAIMDICAAAAPILGSLSWPAGRPVRCLGRLFSVVGQLLSFFGPKQPSLKDQITDMMVGLEAEAKLKTMQSVGTASSLCRQADDASKELPGILALPLRTEAEADEFLIQCRALNIGLLRDQHGWTAGLQQLGGAELAASKGPAGPR